MPQFHLIGMHLQRSRHNQRRVEGGDAGRVRQQGRGVYCHGRAFVVGDLGNRPRTRQPGRVVRQDAGRHVGRDHARDRDYRDAAVQRCNCNRRGVLPTFQITLPNF